MALLLAATRRLGEGERLIRSGRPWHWHMFFMLGTDLHGKTLGIVGLGSIGPGWPGAPAPSACGSPTRNRADAGRGEAGGGAAAAARVARGSDVVSLHCPLSERPAT